MSTPQQNTCGVKSAKGFRVYMGHHDTKLTVRADTIEEAVDKLESYYALQRKETRRNGPLLELRHKNSDEWITLALFEGQFIL